MPAMTRGQSKSYILGRGMALSSPPPHHRLPLHPPHPPLPPGKAAAAGSFSRSGMRWVIITRLCHRSARFGSFWQLWRSQFGGGSEGEKDGAFSPLPTCPHLPTCALGPKSPRCPLFKKTTLFWSLLLSPLPGPGVPSGTCGDLGR